MLNADGKAVLTYEYANETDGNGNVIKTWINGIGCTHLVNDELKKGFFGLQVHRGKEGTIRWRKVRIRELKE